ncbi:MAG: ABC transporter ATP-binding protein [Defluviitaleaceae bacterium]|nr:ABC transporter ATP-binding protein [Defluviitaleaceae bacterium]
MYIIEMRNITKEFPGIIANDNITLQLKKNEIHALLGENGAGKSTLMSVLFGLYKQEKGSIFKNEEEVFITGPGDANRLGIGMVHQHFKLVHNFTVLENIVLGVETTKSGVLQMKEAREKVLALSKRYGFDIDIDKEIRHISVGMQQRVEILKMLYRDNEILIFDEPTAVLTPQEIEALMKTMKDMAAEGKSILFITHKLDEIKQVADRCSVLRKGKMIGTVDVAETSKEEMSEMMVGRKVVLSLDKAEANIGDTILKVRNLCQKGKADKSGKDRLKNISFDVKAGEILCVAGIEGNGQTDLVYALTGLEEFDSGEIEMEGKDISRAKIRKRTEMGIAHIPEDRHKHGLVLDYTLAYNTILQTYYANFQKTGFLKKQTILDYAKRLIERFDIRSGQGEITSTRAMSGGNQQKVILAREIDRDPKLLIAVQPTRGLDVGAIEYIHKQLLAQRDSGKAVLLVSLELEEVMNVSDRILVMYEGEIVADVDPKHVTFQELGLYMSGAKRDEVSVDAAHVKGDEVTVE